MFRKHDENYYRDNVRSSCLVVDFQLKIDTGDFFSYVSNMLPAEKNKTYLTEWMKREIIRL